MAWTAGVTRSTGDLISAADWNNYLGASGSMDFVHDALYAGTRNSYNSSTRAFDTEYQNTTGNIIIVSHSAQLNANGESIFGKTGTISGSLTTRARLVLDTASIDITGSITFVVLDDEYYEVVTAGSPTWKEWHEWRLHT